MFVVSPEGEQFGSARLALVELVRRGAEEKVLEALRNSMKDWKRSDLLPKGWMYRMARRAAKDARDKTQQIEFLDEAGDWIRGRVAAKERLKDYSHEENERFQEFSNNCTVKARMEGYKWNDSDDTIPPGWKSRIVGTKTFYISPEGRQFPSRLAILQHLIRFSGEKRVVDRARKVMMQVEGWEESKFLPYRWIFKHTWTHSQKSKEVLKTVKILSEEGHLMDSYVAVKAYIEEADKYDQEDLNNVDLLVEELAKRTRLQFCQKELPDNVLTKIGKDELSSQDYLPFGWKSKMEGNKEVVSSSLFFIWSFFFFPIFCTLAPGVYQLRWDQM